MTTATPVPSTALHALPAEDLLELADYKIGSFTSDLDLILSAVRGVASSPVDEAEIREYLERKESRPAPEPVDRDAVARILVFAAAVIRDAELIRHDAAELQELALDLFYESAAGRAAVDRHYEIARGWHAAQAEPRAS